MMCVQSTVYPICVESGSVVQVMDRAVLSMSNIDDFYGF